MNAREAAFCALLASLRQEAFVIEELEKWQKKEQPSSRDFKFAQEIALGSARMALALDYIAAQLSTQKKLSLKLKERALVRTAIYQRFFMTKVPLYAIVDETIEIAKKYCHSIFVKYLNALLRQLEKDLPSLPTEKTLQALSIRYSYPLYFVQELIRDYGMDKAEEILEFGNQPPILMMRNRKAGLDKVEVMDEKDFQATIASPDYYIQNITPVKLMKELAANHIEPRRILDLCASPGGKALFIHDCYPQADLYLNDVSPTKLEKLKQNCLKYGIEATFSCGSGTSFQATKPFDLIILDVPCSNSGVLNKRAEARWRLSLENVEKLEKTQLELLEHATTLLTDDGEIWYLTCSIIKRENEHLMERACKEFNLKILKQKLILPNKGGWDGGFACRLQKD